MKISLCLSGQPRALPDSCNHLIEKLLVPNNIKDVFIHCWYDKRFDNAPIQGNCRNNGVFMPESDRYLENNLHPKKMMVEPPRTFDEFKHFTSQYVDETHIASAAYSTMMSNKLKQEYEKENGFLYDVVIKTRIDILYSTIPYIESMVDEHLSTSVYVSAMYQCHPSHKAQHKTKSGKFYFPLSDCFIFGSSPNMDKICSFFNKFEEIYNDLTCGTGEHFYSYAATILNDIKIVPKDFNYILYRV